MPSSPSPSSPPPSPSTAARAGRLSPLSPAPPGVSLSPEVHPLPGGGLLVVPPGPATPRALLVFFHGAGGSAEQSLAAVREPAQEHGVLALLPSSVSGTWDLVLGRPGPDVAALDTALREAARAVPVARVALGGFSDGASYALSLGLANGDLVDAVLAFSPGFAAPPSQTGHPRVYVAHGTEDTVLPVDACGRRVVALLTGAGYEVRYDEFDGPHTVRGGDVRAALEWWLSGGERPA